MRRYSLFRALMHYLQLRIYKWDIKDSTFNHTTDTILGYGVTDTHIRSLTQRVAHAGSAFSR